MKKSFIFICLALAGCAHNLTLMERGGPGTGTGKAAASWDSDGDLTIDLNGKRYVGGWVFASSGSYGLSSYYGGSTFMGTAATIGGVGVGNAMLKAADGEGLRCEFQYSEMSGKGLGVCQDDAGKLYDLQIK